MTYNEKYTEQYRAHEAKIAKAQAQFDANPNTKTATVLSNLKQEAFSIQRHTPQYLAVLAEQEKAWMKAAATRMKNYTTTLYIETEFSSGRLSQSNRIGLHKINNQANPINNG